MTRQKIVDLADAMHFSLSATNTSRLAAVQRTRGLLGSTGAGTTITNDAVTFGYIQWNVDHLDNWFNGGRAITATSGPTLNKGLYLVSFYNHQTVFSNPITDYDRFDVTFEIGSGLANFPLRRTFGQGAQAWSLTGVARVPSNGLQLRVRARGSGAAGATFTIQRNNAEASPRLAWTLLSPD
jgi:hypothetical protein